MPEPTIWAVSNAGSTADGWPRDGRRRRETGSDPGGGSAGAVVVSERDERGEGYDLLAVLETDRASGRLEAEDGRILAVSPATAPAG